MLTGGIPREAEAWCSSLNEKEVCFHTETPSVMSTALGHGCFQAAWSTPVICHPSSGQTEPPCLVRMFIRVRSLIHSTSRGCITMLGPHSEFSKLFLAREESQAHR